MKSFKDFHEFHDIGAYFNLYLQIMLMR